MICPAEDLVPVFTDENGMSGQDEELCISASDAAVFSHEFEYAFSMQLRYNYRLDPWPRHQSAFGKAFGCARVVFNDALAAREAAHQAGEPYVTDSDLSARLTAAKAAPE